MLDDLGHLLEFRRTGPDCATVAVHTKNPRLALEAAEHEGNRSTLPYELPREVYQKYGALHLGDRGPPGVGITQASLGVTRDIICHRQVVDTGIPLPLSP